MREVLCNLLKNPILITNTLEYVVWWGYSITISVVFMTKSMYITENKISDIRCAEKPSVPLRDNANTPTAVHNGCVNSYSSLEAFSWS